MNKLEYGKIKCTTPYSNIFGTVIQLIIRMKKLIEGQYKLFTKYPNQLIIAAIIDAFEQFNDKKEYINIDPFIHSVKEDLNLRKKDIKFKDFLSSILWSIDFSNISQYQYHKQICYTKLYNLINRNEDEEYFFDITLENNKSLSSIIQSQYKFSTSVTNKPDFLFFSPIQNNNEYDNIIIDFDINLSYESYTLSVIVLKKINSNHFILYINQNKWIQFNDENIEEIDQKELINRIRNQSEYQIELFGFSSQFSFNIIDINFVKPVTFKELDYDSLEYEPSIKIQMGSPTRPSVFLSKLSPKPSLEYIVVFKEFKYDILKYQNVKTTKFNNFMKRDEYLETLEKEALSKSCILYFECNESFGTTNHFDSKDMNITVFSVLESEKERFELFHVENLVEIEFYPNDDSTIKDNDITSFKARFKPNQDCSEIFKFCAKKFNNQHFRLLKKMELCGLSCDREIKGSFTEIKSLISSKSPTKIYYDLSGSTQITPSQNVSQNTRPDLSKNLSQNASQYTRPDLSKNLSQNTRQNLSQNASQYTRQNLNQNVSQNDKKIKSETDEKKLSSATVRSPSVSRERNRADVNNEQADAKDKKIIFNRSHNPRSKPTSSIYREADDENYEIAATSPKPVSINEKAGEKFVITRCLRSFLFKGALCVKRIVIKNKSKIKGNIYNLLNIIMKSMDLKILTYYIDKENNFKITFYKDDFMVRDLPGSLNIQVRPHKSHPHRICVIFDIKKTDMSNFDPNIDSCPFAIKYDKANDLSYLKGLIISYLFHSHTNCEEIKKNVSYNPSIYTYDGTFKEIIDEKDLENREFYPIFVTWRSSQVLSEVNDLVESHIEKDTDIVNKIITG